MVYYAPHDTHDLILSFKGNVMGCISKYIHPCAMGWIGDKPFRGCRGGNNLFIV